MLYLFEGTFVLNHSFKNGITVIIPDDLINRLDEWTKVKMYMSLILDPPEPVAPKPPRKEYTHTKEGLKKRRKFWRDRKSKK